MPEREKLLERAARLDDEAVTYRGGGPGADELRRQAAELRREAVGEKPYPVLVCGACFHLTGWLDSSGVCAADSLRRQEEERAGFPDLRDLRAHPHEHDASFAHRLGRNLGIGRARDVVQAWEAKVEPGETGPIEPEEGWEVETAFTYERRAPEGPDLLVCFDAQSLRFQHGRWQEIETSRAGKPPRLGPREFSASLSMEQLAEAWNDFREEVSEHNRRSWTVEADRREAQRRTEAERRAAEELERGTSDLLK